RLTRGRQRVRNRRLPHLHGLVGEDVGGNGAGLSDLVTQCTAPVGKSLAGSLGMEHAAAEKAEGLLPDACIEGIGARTIRLHPRSHREMAQPMGCLLRGMVT